MLEAHQESSQGLFRGIRHAGARAEHPEALSIPGQAPEGLFEDPAFLTGIKVLGKNGFTYDAWHYHYQTKDFSAIPSGQIAVRKASMASQYLNLTSLYFL